jgi:hypothetical protein
MKVINLADQVNSILSGVDILTEAGILSDLVIALQTIAELREISETTDFATLMIPRILSNRINCH